MNLEIWRDIPGYEGRYQISNYGRVYSFFHDCVLIPKICGRGYQGITLSCNGRKQRFYIHRLVAGCFLPKPLNKKYEVNHKDFDKHNNHVSNLEWVTPKQNFEHAYRNGKFDFRRTMRSDNKTGTPGVGKHAGGYQVTICFNGQRIYLGWFKDLKTAINVRKKAEGWLLTNEVH